VHPLLAQAREQSRRIYASLPWGYRVARLVLHLASGLTDIIGRVTYLDFIKSGVVDMPPINGETPARTLKAVPVGYGKHFGDRLYALLLSKSKHPDTVEDVLSTLMTQIAEGKMKLREGASLREAESYVIQWALNTLKMIWRKDNSRREQGMPEGETEDGAPIDFNFEDPNSFRHLDKLIPKSELSRLMHDLERVHERAPSWLEAKLDGLRGVEIAQEWGVGKSYITGWEQQYVPAIKRVLTRYIQDAA